MWKFLFSNSGEWLTGNKKTDFWKFQIYILAKYKKTLTNAFLFLLLILQENKPFRKIIKVNWELTEVLGVLFPRWGLISFQPYISLIGLGWHFAVKLYQVYKVMHIFSLQIHIFACFVYDALTLKKCHLNQVKIFGIQLFVWSNP